MPRGMEISGFLSVFRPRGERVRVRVRVGVSSNPKEKGSATHSACLGHEALQSVSLKLQKAPRPDSQRPVDLADPTP